MFHLRQSLKVIRQSLPTESLQRALGSSRRPCNPRPGAYYSGVAGIGHRLHNLRARQLRTHAVPRPLRQGAARWRSLGAPCRMSIVTNSHRKHSPTVALFSPTNDDRLMQKVDRNLPPTRAESGSKIVIFWAKKWLGVRNSTFVGGQCRGHFGFCRGGTRKSLILLKSSFGHAKNALTDGQSCRNAAGFFGCPSVVFPWQLLDKPRYSSEE